MWCHLSPFFLDFFLLLLVFRFLFFFLPLPEAEPDELQVGPQLEELTTAVVVPSGLTGVGLPSESTET